MNSSYLVQCQNNTVIWCIPLRKHPIQIKRKWIADLESLRLGNVNNCINTNMRTKLQEEELSDELFQPLNSCYVALINDCYNDRWFDNSKIICISHKNNCPQNEVPLSCHRVRELYFLPAIFAAIIFRVLKTVAMQCRWKSWHYSLWQTHSTIVYFSSWYNKPYIVYWHLEKA